MRKIFISLLVFVSSILSAQVQTGHFFPADQFSSGLINDICQDRYGYIWIATDYGLNKFDGYRFTTYLHDPADTLTLCNNVVGCMFCDNDGQLWVGTSKGLDRYDYATDEFIHYPFDRGSHPRVSKLDQQKDGRLIVCTSGYHGLYQVKGSKVVDFMTNRGDDWLSFINSVLEDSKGRFWKCGYDNDIIYSDASGEHKMTSTQGFVVDFVERSDEILIICLHGIHSYRNGQLAVADIDLSSLGGREVIFRRVFQDSDGNIYIGTRGDGLFRLAANSRRLERVEGIAPGIDLNSAKIWAITEDRLGNIWLGCQSKGLLMLPKQQPQFQSWSFAAQGLQISSTVTSVCSGDDGIIWCTVQGNGVYGFSSEGRIVSHPSSPSNSDIIYRDHQKRYWIGANESLYRYEPSTGRAEKLLTRDCDRFNTMTDDGEGNLYISTFSRGFCIYNTESRKMRCFSSSQHDSNKGWLCNNWVMAMLPDHAGRVWIATSSGVSCYDPKADSFRPYGWHQLLEGVMCFSLCETQRGHLLIGTEKGLYIYEPGKQQAEPFLEDENSELSGRNSVVALRSKVVGYIAEANNGDLWLSTSMGIWQYAINKRQFIGHVNGNGLTAKEYINCVGLHTDSDVIYFANNNGLTVFRPQDVTGSHKALPAVSLTGFMIAGHPVNTLSKSNGVSVVDGPTITSDHFNVSYLDNAVTLEFSLLDFNNPENILFEYRINDGKWFQNVEGQNSIQLSHLQPGTYRIEVRALSAGIYSPSKMITVKVTPPWYRTTWAYIFYALMVIGLLWLLSWNQRKQTRRQLDEEKMKFLINATHDIRSPLTLIMGPLRKLKNSKIEELKTTEEIQSFNSSILQPSIDTIDRNAQRLMLLVNQILDERKIDKDQMQLHCRETNLVEFISGICKLYQYNAGQRNITFLFEHDKDHLLAWIDRINFDKVISNLLSNAFKYTYDGGEVKITLRELEHDVEIQVVDSGMGIKDEDKDHLFDRFYQGRNADSLGMQGTGIGLNLSQNIVKMHGGQIKAQNRTDGQQGACFTVTIPLGTKHLKPEQIITDSPAREVLSAGSRPAFRQFHILIVDDDHEIADYIIGELGDKYKFDHAPNGKEALKTLLTGQYDLVISDVMMPEMDGITLLKRIKDNPTISQLPVIMLTSKAEVENKLEGLKSGADAYIAKPFNMEELHIQIDNLIDNVRRLRGKFSGALQQEDRVENIEVTGNDDALMSRIMRFVNAHMSDPDYNVDALASDVGISRSQLHRKMKEITGVSSGKFLRNLRMEQAARLLREGKVNVSQVGDKVGYADQAHFSTAFKNHFGVSPSEYLEKHKSV